ncbi:hypothetical protein vseg_013498 [Gypsophila vaccaria]
MANRPESDDDDDEFSNIYKAYTGPVGTTSATTAQEKPQSNSKRPRTSEDDEEEERDPNAVPTDFTSREAKVWEAKSKATERNWKKRTEEEMICKICGESGHFTQGCPSTLGGNRNSQDFFERVAARDKHVRALFTDDVIKKIEKDIGCKIRMDEKFIIVSGKDRLVLRKGVDAVHKVKEEGNDKDSLGSYAGRSRSSERSPIGNNSRFSRSEPQRSNPSPRNTSQFPRFGRQKSLEERRDDLQKPSRNSPQAYGTDGGRGRSSHSRSPARVSYSGSAYNTYEAHRQGIGAYKSGGWEAERRGSDLQANNKFEQSSVPPQTLEDLEMEYQREAINVAKLRDQQIDEENYKHHENSRGLRDSFMKRLAALRASHSKQWEDFLHLDAQRRRQQIQKQQVPVTEYGSYQRSSFADHDSLGGQPYPSSNFHMEPRGQYATPSENYPPSRPHDAYDDFQRHRLEGYGRSYDRY